MTHQERCAEFEPWVKVDSFDQPLPYKRHDHRITGQDGSYLKELLLEKGYQVFGIVGVVFFNTIV